MKSYEKGELKMFKASRKNKVIKVFSKSNYENIKGSFTLEASLVFPLVLICVIGIMQITLILYRKVGIQTLTNYSIRRGESIWDNINKDIDTGKIIEPENEKNSERYPLYWNLYDNNKRKKEDKLKEFMVLQLKNNALLYDNNTNINVKLSNYFIFKRLNLEVISCDKMKIQPNEELYLHLRHKSRVVIRQPSDFIRNIDFLLEIEKELEEKYQGFGELMDKMKKFINDITKNIKKFGG